MKWSSFALVAMAICVATAASGEAAKSYSHRYRLTLEVEANGSMRAGSGVTEVTWVRQPQKLPIGLPEFVAKVRGDAVVVDLGAGQALVALLGPADPSDVPTSPEFLAMRAYGLADSNAAIPLISKQAGVRRLEGSDVPALIFFPDSSKPESGRIASRRSRDSELAPGIKFLGATIEITSDPVTNDIGKKLPWWSMPGRPASQARRAWMSGAVLGASVEPETLFRRQ